MTGSPKNSAYAEAGVDIDAQDRALDRVKELARSTHTPGVLTEIGSFGGLFLPDLTGLREPVLVASADGVGTKLMVARMAGDYSGVGRDLVNHCVNDILVQGARPLFFLDYVGAGVLEPAAMAELVSGVAVGCRENGCALLGGETAEMPGFYQPGDYELVGFVVGLVDRPAILDGRRIRPGQVLIGLPSSGLHTNGYSLVRRIVFDRLGLEPETAAPWGGGTVASELLTPHRSYLAALQSLLADPVLTGLAHITGGGLTDNLPRILPAGCRAEVDLGAWRVPEIFRFLQRAGEVAWEEMLQVFNLGIGMVVVAEDESVMATLEAAGEAPIRLGKILEGPPGVAYRGDFGDS
ncbi:MAG: phosphoribosylformylglycinamidine cyclo-ligase [Acidobacteriota bacterium]